MRTQEGTLRGPQRQAGQTMAEFAITLAVFVLILLGIIDLSRAVLARNVIADLAREGARYAIVHRDGPDANIIAVTKEKAVGVDRSQLEVTVSRPVSDYVQVDVSYRFYPVSLWMARYVDGGAGGGLLLRSSSRMLVVH